MMKCLKAGQGVVIFPEGTYFKDKVGPGRSGLIKMIRSRESIPFIPVGINYAKTGRPTRVRIRIGKPVRDDPSMTAAAFMGRIMKDIERLSGF